ncbi:response regulator transcription factor [Lacisediminimonas sp.]|uniref:response regulator transcription factor n=1 Tax=Lacisediminimonas sp. TaxID=3060582 RepID=UPI002728AA8F|nr:response regulator transcription factor [Lacisediminimonas sp.]MDO8300255.1 response regulator transcription factor [Lacisediminimonas sp.]
MRVLLVEDDLVLADGISRILKDNGMAVEMTHSGTDADNILLRSSFTILVLDIGLPGIDGFALLRRLRSRGSTMPVLLLTARDAVHDRVHGLELGADDYLVKPFDTSELVARLRALDRRATPKTSALEAGGLVLDLLAKRARIGDDALELSAREWAVLEYLMRQAERVVSKQQIMDAILHWGEELSENAVEVYVSRVRIKTAAADLSIRTIRGFGYMLEKRSP